MKRTLFLIALTSVSAVHAAEAQGWRGASLVPQNEARDAARNGRSMPFARIRARIKAEFGGELSDAEMYSRGNGVYYYEVIWMAGDGRRLKLEVDAQSGQILSSRGG